MYSYEIDNIIKENNYNMSSSVYETLISSPQINHIKYDAYSDDFQIWTTGGYYWKIKIYFWRKRNKMAMHKKVKTEEIKEINILDFCKGYRNTLDNAKSDYITNNLKIKSYLPVVEKDVLAQRIVNATMYEWEGEKGERKRSSDNVHINSIAQRILFVRAIIEAYTNLKSTTEGFYEEYDALKQSGLYDILLVDYEDHPALIPNNEISECSDFVQLKIHDIYKNVTSPAAFVSQQVERFGKLANLTIEPVLNALQSKINNISEEDMNNVIQMAKTGKFKEVNN